MLLSVPTNRNSCFDGIGCDCMHDISVMSAFPDVFTENMSCASRPVGTIFKGAICKNILEPTLFLYAK